MRLALGDVRQSVRALRGEAPRPLLSAALADLAHSGEARPQVTVEVSGDQDGYGTLELTSLYRAAQEGVTNARRHARATPVTVVLRLADDAARLVVTDDGRDSRPPEWAP